VPGEFLGAKDATHAHCHSAASASHIRIALKDDNLGLGAKGGVNDEDGQTTGLDMYQDLLGRLNGKTEREVDNEKRMRSNVRRSVFVEQTWGKLRFVSGGFLLSKEPPSVNSMAKQCIQDFEEAAPDGVKTDQKRSPKEQGKRKCEREQRVRDESNERSFASPQSARETFIPQKSSLEVDCAAQDTDRAKGWAEKAERKLKRKARKEARSKSKNANSLPSMALSLSDPMHLQPQLPAGQGTAEHTGPNTSLPSKAPFAVVGGRNAVRQRYIQHKKMAMMDSKALNEVCRHTAAFSL